MSVTLSAPGAIPGQARVKDGVFTGFSGGAAEITRKGKNSEIQRPPKWVYQSPKKTKWPRQAEGCAPAGYWSRRRPQEPPEERSVCTTVRFNRIFWRSIFKPPSQDSLVYTWFTRSYSSRRHQLSTCLCARPHCACVCLVYIVLMEISLPDAWVNLTTKIISLTIYLDCRLKGLPSELTLGYVRAWSSFSWYNSELGGQTNRRSVVR